MAKLTYYPDEMGSLLRDKFTTDTHAPPALQLEYDESKYTDVDSAEVKKIVLEHAVDRLREELEQQPVEDAYAHQLVTWRLFLLMRDLEMFDFDYHLKWSLWLTLNGHMKFKWSDFCTTQLQHFNADTALQWMLAATQGFYAEAKTSRYKMYFSNRKASELYWSMVVFFDMACRLELIQQNPCRIPQAIESHFSRNGKHLIWQNPTQFAW